MDPIEIYKRQITQFIEKDMLDADMGKFPEDVIQETYLDLIEHLADTDLQPSLFTLGAMFWQGLEDTWKNRLVEAAEELPFINLREMHQAYPHTAYEVAPWNDRGVYAILIDLDTGAIIGPMTEDMTADHTAMLMSRVRGN